VRGQVRYAVCLLAICALAWLPPSAARAAPRSPQVAISGSGLQDYFQSVGESYIDVRTGQDAIQFLAPIYFLNSSFTIEFELVSGKPLGSSVGIYDASLGTPVPIEILPSEAVPGWFAVVTFRTSPLRVAVHAFDEKFELRSSTTYPGGNRNAVGIYLDGPGGRFYSQDQRNPASDPQLLWFPGQGVFTGQWWIAGEDASLSGGADGDFDDVIILAEPFGCPCPVQKCSWGAAKARFR